MEHWNTSVVEAASWRLASTLVRRQPHLTLFEMHPAGGTYDVLCLRSKAGAEVMLNRVGTIQVHGREDDQPAHERPIEWSEYLSADSGMGFAERIEAEAALPPAILRPMTRPAMVYKIISALAGLGCLGEPFTITQGIFDSSGPGGSSYASWWEEMRTLDRDLTEPLKTDLIGEAAYRFWRVERSDFQLTFETSSGSAWVEVEADLYELGDLDEIQLASKYCYDLVDWASIEGYVDDGEAPLSGDWSLPSRVWPSPGPSRQGPDADHEFDPMVRLLRAVLELGAR